LNHTYHQKFGINKCYLMTHSLSGIYSLAYANKYPYEIAEFIGLDITQTNYIENCNKNSIGKK